MGRTRKEREKRLQGRAGCAGLLSVLRETYGDEAEACSAEVFSAASTFVQTRRLRHVCEIAKFKKVEELVKWLPNLDEAKAAALRESISKHAQLEYEDSLGGGSSAAALYHQPGKVVGTKGGPSSTTTTAVSS